MVVSDYMNNKLMLTLNDDGKTSSIIIDKSDLKNIVNELDK